jgi:hypothetical protein
VLLNTDFHSWTKKTFPTGEIVTNEFWISSGWQGSSRCNRLYFQENYPASREALNISIIDEEKLPVCDAELFKYNGFLVLLVLHEHIFQHTVSKDKSYWREITWQGDQGALEYLATFLKPNENQYSTMQTPNRGYWFDHVDFDRGLLVTKQHSINNQFPLYLVYSTAASYFPGEIPSSVDYGWVFDLEQTRAANGLPPPDCSGLVVDVSVRRLPHVSEVSTSNIAIAQPVGTELCGQTFPASSTKWTRLDFVPQPVPGEIHAKTEHDDFLFGFPNASLNSYVMCYRGADFECTRYASVNLGEWYASQGPFTEEMVFFRLRKQTH